MEIDPNAYKMSHRDFINKFLKPNIEYLEKINSREHQPMKTGKKTNASCNIKDRND